MNWISKKDDEINNMKKLLKVNGVVSEESKQMKAMGARVNQVLAQNQELKSLLAETATAFSDLKEKEAKPEPAPALVNQASAAAGMQQMMAKLEAMEARISALKPSNNTGGFKGTFQDHSGRSYTYVCGNCGAQLEPGRCKDGCIKIKRGYSNLPFPTEEERKKVTIHNYKEFPNCCQKNMHKLGKEWSTTLSPHHKEALKQLQAGSK